jgi:hypothetical protein
MKKWILVGALAVISTAASAQYGGYGTGSNSNSHQRSGYTTQSGTYVAPSQATNPNNSTSDNYGTRGNYNPYTGATGTRNPR